MKAIWNGTVVAESDDTVVVEGNHYFPRAALREEFVVASATTSSCGWKGMANYYTLEVDGERNTDAAWYYAAPLEAAKAITGRVAFWRGVKIEP
jgi:uncharacterized protein (DUF427 family)